MNQTFETSRLSTAPSPRPERYALLHGEWHADIVDSAVTAFVAEMTRLGVSPESIDRYPIAGAFEAPLMARRLARSGRYDALVACAFVVDGGVYRHDFVAATVLDGLMRVQLDTDTPVLSVVLAPHQFRSEAPLAAMFADHFAIKGVEAARACVNTCRRLAAV